MGAGLIHPHEAGIASHVGGQDRHQPPVDSARRGSRHALVPQRSRAATLPEMPTRSTAPTGSRSCADAVASPTRARGAAVAAPEDVVAWVGGAGCLNACRHYRQSMLDRRPVAAPLDDKADPRLRGLHDALGTVAVRMDAIVMLDAHQKGLGGDRRAVEAPGHARRRLQRFMRLTAGATIANRSGRTRSALALVCQANAKDGFGSHPVIRRRGVHERFWAAQRSSGPASAAG